jgi:2-polyprenyl-3-methyl-5-hydroxy-6-metoxy-1,4-benzoquinol methylase
MNRSAREYIPSFMALLQSIPLKELKLPLFPETYFSYLLNNAAYFLRTYAQLLDMVPLYCKKSREELTIVDHGCGNGWLGLFASYCGFGKIIFIDRDKEFIQSAQQLAAAMRLEGYKFITGNTEDLVNACREDTIDLILSTDVFEHVYDPLDFLKQVKKINEEIILLFKTPSNPSNPFLNRRLKKMQYKDEWLGGKADDFATFGESHEPYREIRRKIIVAANSTFSLQEVESLVNRTRGLIQEDIIKAVQNYITTGQLPPQPVHPTNTCHPLTGSWTERLLTRREYTSLFNQAGFKVTYAKGFYNQWKQNKQSAFVTRLANYFIRVVGFYLAPYIILCAYGRKENATSFIKPVKE